MITISGSSGFVEHCAGDQQFVDVVERRECLLRYNSMLVRCAFYLLMAEGLRRSELFRSDSSLSKPLFGVRTVLIFIGVLLIVERGFAANERAFPYPVRRTIGIILFSGILAGFITLFIEDSNYIRYTIAAYYGVGAFCLFGLLFGFKVVKFFYLIHDIVCGHLIFIPLFLLAALQLPRLMQTWLLYHNALSADVVVSDILRYAQKSQESGASAETPEDLIEQITELRKLVQKQETILSNAGLLEGDSARRGSLQEGTIPPPPPKESAVRSTTAPIPSYGRAISMSGLDVWGTMAVGDHTTEELRPVDTQTGGSSEGQAFSFTQPDTMPPRYP